MSTNDDTPAAPKDKIGSFRGLTPVPVSPMSVSAHATPLCIWDVVYSPATCGSDEGTTFSDNESDDADDNHGDSTSSASHRTAAEPEDLVAVHKTELDRELAASGLDIHEMSNVSNHEAAKSGMPVDHEGTTGREADLKSFAQPPLDTLDGTETTSATAMPLPSGGLAGELRPDTNVECTNEQVLSRRVANTGGLLDREQRIHAEILDRFQGLILAGTAAISDDETVATAALRGMKMKEQTDGLVKAIEDMLHLCRELKELWIQGPLRQPGEGEAEMQAAIDVEIEGLFVNWNRVIHNSRQALMAKHGNVGTHNMVDQMPSPESYQPGGGGGAVVATTITTTTTQQQQQSPQSQNSNEITSGGAASQQ